MSKLWLNDLGTVIIFIDLYNRHFYVDNNNNVYNFNNYNI